MPERDLYSLDDEDRYIREKYGVDEFVCKERHPRVSFFEPLDFYLDDVKEDRFYVYRSQIWIRTIVVFDELRSEYILAFERDNEDRRPELVFGTAEELKDAYRKGKISLV